MNVILCWNPYAYIGLLVIAAGCAPRSDANDTKGSASRTTRAAPALAFSPTLSNPALPTTGPGASPTSAVRIYPLHGHVTSTIFWVGEPPAKDSPSNAASAWDDDWQVHFGGFDNPARRDGFAPAGFAPRENSFYVALPYNDLHAGRRRADAARVIAWATGRTWFEDESMCKNHWVCLLHNGLACYAQWEDVGPFRSDDAAYVFGHAVPRNTRNRGAGIDVSPAVRDHLGLSDIDTVDWRFVEERDVPPGPWTRTVTTSQVHWR